MNKDKIFPLKVYTFIDSKGHHHGYEVVNSEEELAQKIVTNEQNKLVTDFMDLPVFDTFGSFVNRVYDNTEEWGEDAPNYKPWFINKFKPILLKAQGFEDFHPCGDCAEYPDCENNPKDCEYSEAYEDYLYVDEDTLYAEMCADCPNSKRCHEDCTHCEDYLNRLEGGE